MPVDIASMLQAKTAAVVMAGLKPIIPAPMPVEILVSVRAAARIVPSFIVTLPVQRRPAANGSLRIDEIMEKKVFFLTGGFSEGAVEGACAFLRNSVMIIQKPMPIRREAPILPAVTGCRNPESIVPKSIEKRLPLLLNDAIIRFRDTGMHIFLNPYETPVPKLSRLAETARNSIDRMCNSFK